jgi:hypothetical protein
VKGLERLTAAPKEEPPARIEVGYLFPQLVDEDESPKWHRKYSFLSTDYITPDKGEAILRAIEAVVNGEVGRSMATEDLLHFLREKNEADEMEVTTHDQPEYQITITDGSILEIDLPIERAKLIREMILNRGMLKFKRGY